jgi:hypothetical protein
VIVLEMVGSSSSYFGGISVDLIDLLVVTVLSFFFDLRALPAEEEITQKRFVMF